MINDFIKKTIIILKNSDINIRLPVYNRVEINGKEKTVYIHIQDSTGETKLKDNLIFHLMVFFSLIDAYIDNKYPILSDKSFAKKYKGLNDTKDFEIIIKEIYRILKILRNASIHSKNSINIYGNEKINIDYHYNKTDFKLRMNITCLELIYTVILLVIEENYPFIYLEGLMRTYYDDITDSLELISDDFGSESILNISSSIRLKRKLRYKIESDVIFDSEKNELNIINYSKPNEWEKEYTSTDYYISLNGKNYIIPDEILDKDGNLSFYDIAEWEIL